MSREKTTARALAAGSSFLLAFAAAKLLLHLLTARGYGYFRDELYYIACTDHLDWGYVDQPPLSILLLWISRHLFGDSLFALRLLPALAGAATVYLTGWTCRRMGGGRLAQALAMLSVIVAPAYLFIDHIFSMNAFDVLFWTAAAAVLVRVFDDGDRRLWILLGAVLGAGLLNKISVLWLGFGLLIGLRASRAQRGWYMTPWPWISGALSLAIFSPHVAWQVAHGWPTLRFMENAARLKMASTTPWRFLADAVLLMHPLTLPVWTAGLALLLFGTTTRKFRPLGTIFLVVVALLLAFRSKPYYLAPACTVLLAAGGVAIERFLARRRWTRAAVPALVALAAGGIILAPMGLPLLPVGTFVRYASFLGIQPGSGERHEIGTMPQHFADMFGWEEMVAAVARAYDTLSPDEKPRAGIFAQNYGEAGAIDFFGKGLGLPEASSGHNAYWHWGPPERSVDTWIILGGDEADNREVCGDLLEVARTDCDLCMPYEDDLPVYVCRRLRTPVADLWPTVKKYI